MLTVDETGPPIVSYAMKNARNLVIAETQQKNLVMNATRVSGMAALQNGIFDALKRLTGADRGGSYTCRSITCLSPSSSRM